MAGEPQPGDRTPVRMRDNLAVKERGDLCGRGRGRGVGSRFNGCTL